MATKKLTLKIDAEKCKGCVFCVNVCPRKALELSKEVNKKGFRYVVLKDPDKCSGCGLCAVVCPDCSITLEEE